MTTPQPAFAPPPLSLPRNDKAYRFHVMVKPTGAQCNLDCAYCFYLHKEDLLQQSRTPRMSDALLEAHIQQYIAAQTGEEVIFSWQGGEPTLMGLDFFRRVVALQARYQKPGQRIGNDLQTNGILLDDEWCQFLKANHFLVGLSIDGPAGLHDKYRYSKGGKPTHERVMQSVALLHHHQVPFSALCVVNRHNAKEPLAVYRFLRDQVRPRQIQFNACVETTGFHSDGPGYWGGSFQPPAVTDWSVEPVDWGNFLCQVWDEWFRRDFGKVFVDQFENVISQMFGFGPQKCTSGKICGKALAIEHDGDVYSCDHYVYPEYRLGNIRDIHEGHLAFSDQQIRFALAKSESLPAYCRQCLHLDLCWGECPKNRFLGTPDGEAGLNYLCSGLKKFYGKASSSRQELARRLQLRRVAP